MRILLLGINYAPELTGVGKYSGEMMHWFASNKHDVKVITAPPYYPDWKVSDSYSQWKYTVEQCNNETIYRCPLYVPIIPSTFKRLLHLISFAFFSFPLLLRQLFWKPDVIIVVEPTSFIIPSALIYSFVTRCQSVLHIQDFEVDAMFGLGMMKKKGALSKFAFEIESFFMKRFDRVSTISNKMMELAEQKGVRPENLIYFPNWVDTNYLMPDRKNRGYYLKKWGFKKSDVIILYSGNIGEKQGLDIILNAAKTIVDAKFIIVGEGAYKSTLFEKYKASKLDNICFHPLESYENLKKLLNFADIHLVVQKRGAADVVMPSKLTSILAVGGMALITAEKNTELGQLLLQYPGIAELVEPENKAQFVMQLKRMVSDVDTDKRQFNSIARSYAVKKLEYGNVLMNFEQNLKKI